ncbi:MAG: hypothetical protein ACYC7I_11675, partial [Gammaproteobacteria bacterium]
YLNKLLSSALTAVAVDSAGFGLAINIPSTLNSIEILNIFGFSLSIFDLASARRASATPLCFGRPSRVRKFGARSIF